MTTVGVTGTNGKTTTTLFTGAALGPPPPVMATTLGYFVGGERFAARHDLGGFLATMEAGWARGAGFAAIELTSEALSRGFIRAWPCRVGVFTNLSRDHLDAHGSAEHYLASKAQLFMQLPAGGVAVLNAADAASALLAEVVPAGVEIVRYASPTRGVFATADLWAETVALSWEGTRIVVGGAFTGELAIRSIGAIYAENALAALSAAIGLGVDPAVAIRGIAAAPPVPGRFEVVAREPYVIVDYAHSPDALARTLATARSLARGAVIVVFGAGGERDRDKRPLMGAAAGGADAVIVTSDNPRGEDPARIAAAIVDGLPVGTPHRVELDRRRAIEGAIADCRPGDVVVIAGKGHETTQQLASRDIPFEDAAIARVAHRGSTG
jgi:UDP-N-acetylmuramoyl-L-alanyl-D-glutamate--2,6-diaminopimelate ligase